MRDRVTTTLATAVRTLTLGVALLVAREAAAEEAAPPPVDAEAFERAREHFRQGVRLTAEEHWEAALALFDESLRVYPTQSALFNRGLCLKELNRYPEAILAFEELLERYGAEIDAERRAAVETELEQLRGLVGRIAVELDRAGAVVLVDGVEVGRTPLESPHVVTAGRHRVEVRAEGFQPLRRDVTVAGGAQVTIRPSLAVIEAPGTLEVSLAVPDASISIDGERVGASPLAEALSVQAGPHVVTATRPGYAPARTEVVVSSGEAARVELTLTPVATLPLELAGELEVHVSERGARVLVDGEPLAEGPVPVGAHRVEVALEGYAPWSRMVEVGAGRPTWIEATLHPDAHRRAAHRRHATGVRIASYTLFGVAAATLGTALGVFLWNHFRYEDRWVPEDQALEEAYSMGQWEEDPTDEALWARVEANDELYRSLRTYDFVAGGLLGAGLATAAIATIMILAGPDPDRYSTVALDLRPGGLVIAFEGALP